MHKRPLGFACLAVAALLFLVIRLRPMPEEDYEKLRGKTVTVTGRVYAKQTKAREQETIQVLYLKREDKEADVGDGSFGETSSAGEKDLAREEGPAGEETPVPGQRILCYLRAGEREPELGSRVRVKGKLSTFERASNPGQFDARSYYQILKISYRLDQAEISEKTVSYDVFLEKLYQLRKFLSGKLSQALPGEEASVMQTMLLGEKNDLDPELKELYRRSGIAHILSIMLTSKARNAVYMRS